MCNIKSFLKAFVSVALVLTFLIGCAPSAAQATHQNIFAPSLLGEWLTGNVNDMAWSPDGRMFAVNYWIDGDVSNNFIQAFDVESLNSLWIAKNSLAMNLVFTQDGQFTLESNMFAPFFYWRSTVQGEVVRQGEFTDLSQIKLGDCNGGGQLIIANANQNTALILDYNNLLGPRTNNIVVIRQLDLETGKCKNLIEYQGSFDLFDLDSSGTFLVFGGEGEDDSAVIWDVKNQSEVCRTSKVDFGRFVPSENTLAVVRGQKIVFIDGSTCQELRELNLALSFETYLAFSPDGKQFAIVRELIQIISVSTGEILAQLPLPENAIPNSSNFFLSGIKFSPDGNFLLVAYYLLDSADHGKVQLWQLKP